MRESNSSQGNGFDTTLLLKQVFLTNMSPDMREEVPVRAT